MLASAIQAHSASEAFELELPAPKNVCFLMSFEVPSHLTQLQRSCRVSDMISLEARPQRQRGLNLESACSACKLAEILNTCDLEKLIYVDVWKHGFRMFWGLSVGKPRHQPNGSRG